MKEFQSVFRNELEEYLKINQGTVNEDTLRNTRRVLLSFDSSLAEENTNVISEAAVNRWIREIRQTNAAKTVSDKVSYLRKFLRYLQYKGYRVFMPDCPKTSDSYVPYIFSDEEIQILLARADSWADKHTDPKICQTDMEFCMLLRMLLGCGFRLGEPLAAKVKDINFQSGTILIRHAKNNKQRVIPMDVTLTQMLERYCIAMGIKTEPESYLFPSSKNKGAAVSKGTFDLRFRNLLQETGLYVPGKAHSRGQCLHCFRHYFAIHSFAQAEQNGRPAEDSVPFLSVYLGHHDMNETEKYGYYHATNEGYCSWAEFAQAIMDKAGLRCKVRPVPTSEYPTAAKRPYNSRMSKRSLDEAGFRRLPTWQDALERYIDILQEED